jgi:hypothetical protein
MIFKVNVQTTLRLSTMRLPDGKVDLKEWFCTDLQHYKIDFPVSEFRDFTGKHL